MEAGGLKDNVASTASGPQVHTLLVAGQDEREVKCRQSEGSVRVNNGHGRLTGRAATLVGLVFVIGSDRNTGTDKRGRVRKTRLRLPKGQRSSMEREPALEEDQE